MVTVNFALMLFVIEFSISSYIGVISLKRYLDFKYLADIQLSFAFGLGAINSFLRYFITLLNDMTTITTIYRFLNFSLMIQIFFIYTAFTIYYSNEINFSIITFAFLTGLLTGAFLYDPKFKAIYDSTTQSYNGVYSNTLLLIIVPLILLAFARVIQPLLRKAKQVDNKKDKQSLIIMSIGIAIVMIWGIGAGFTSIPVVRMYRPIIFVLGWIIWFIGGKSNPFFLSISNASPKALYISNSSGHLYYNYNFNFDEPFVAELITPLVSAVNSIANDVFQSKHGIEEFKMGDSIVFAIHMDDYYFHLIATDEDDTLIAMLKYFAKLSIDKLNKARSYEEVDLTDLTIATFSKLQVIEKEISVIPNIN